MVAEFAIGLLAFFYMDAGVYPWAYVVNDSAVIHKDAADGVGAELAVYCQKVISK